MSRFQQFCQLCVQCGNATSKSFARAHDGKCKSCVTGVVRERDISKHPLLCPSCGEHLRTQYQKDHGYKCDSCVREFDRATGYAENPEFRFGSYPD